MRPGQQDDRRDAGPRAQPGQNRQSSPPRDFRFDNERVKVKVLVMTLLLNGLSEDQQRELLAAGSPRSLKPRDVLGAQGEPAESIALVQVGHLKLGQVNADGAETLVRFIGPGDCYGAIALSPGKRFPVSAVAVEPSRVLVWPRMAIVGLAERIPQIRLNLFEEVTRRMGGVLSAVQDLAAERAPVRIARALLRVAEHGGEQSPQGIRIVHPITRQEIADLTGTTLFTVSRLMSKWESDGLLRTGRGAVTIVDPEGLERAASSSGLVRGASPPGAPLLARSRGPRRPAPLAGSLAPLVR